MWFAMHDKNFNNLGLLSINNNNLEQEQLFPLHNFSDDLTPVLIPSHSVSVKEGYACIFECKLLQEKELKEFSL
jgi:hypothetical protein